MPPGKHVMSAEAGPGRSAGLQTTGSCAPASTGDHPDLPWSRPLGARPPVASPAGGGPRVGADMRRIDQILLNRWRRTGARRSRSIR